jgi:hypothetical protein
MGLLARTPKGDSSLCGQGAAGATGAQYFGVVFQFRRAGGGTLGLLWTREAGQWKLVSFQPIAQ